MAALPPDELMSLALWGTASDDGNTGRRAGRSRNLHELINAIGLALPGASTAEAARLRHRLGYLALSTGDVRGKAHEAFTLVREGAVKAGDPALEALAHCGLAAVFDFVGERHESVKHALEGKRLAEGAGDRRTLAIALNAEAQFYKETGENPRAFELFKEVEAIGRELGDEQLVMGAHVGMGRTAPMHEAAVGIRHYEEAIELAREQDDGATLALSLNNLSDWMIYTGQHEEAIRLREESLRLSMELGLRPAIGRSLIGQAKVRTLMGELDRARELLDMGFPAVVSIGDLEGDLHSQLNLAHLHVRDGEISRAMDLYRQVLERSLAAPDHACAVFAQRALALLAEGGVPAPGILPEEPVDLEDEGDLGDLEPDEDELHAVVGGAVSSRGGVYPTGDMAWYPN